MISNLSFFFPSPLPTFLVPATHLAYLDYWKSLLIVISKPNFATFQPIIDKADMSDLQKCVFCHVIYSLLILSCYFLFMFQPSILLWVSEYTILLKYCFLYLEHSAISFPSHLFFKSQSKYHFLTSAPYTHTHTQNVHPNTLYCPV